MPLSATTRDQIAHASTLIRQAMSRVEFAGPQRAVAGAIEHGAKTVASKQLGQSVTVFGVARDMPGPGAANCRAAGCR